MKKIWFSLLMIVALVAVAVLPSVTPVAAQEAPEFKVAVVTPSAVDDLAFSQSMIDALEKLSEELAGFSYVVQDGTFVVDDAAVALRDWAASGEYNLIIAHGSQYGAILEELAPEFPDVSFAWGTDKNTFGLDNVFAYEAASQEGGYVLGVLAGTMTESGKIGVVGPIEVGDAKLFVDGFIAGSEVSGAATTATYIGSFGDVQLATEAAQAFVDDGADVLTGTAQMVVGAIGVAQENEALWFGTQASQAELAGEVGVAFQVYHWEVVVLQIIDLISQGTLGGQTFTLTLENGGLAIEYGEYELSEEQLALVETTIAGIVDGSIIPLPDAAEPAATEEG